VIARPVIFEILRQRMPNSEETMGRSRARIRGVCFVSFFLASSLAGGAIAGCTSGDGASSVQSSTAHPLDTAILFPLPETAEEDSLLHGDASGEKGVLIPDYVWSSIPALTAEKNADIFPKLRLVSANVDPCFPSGKDGEVDDKGVSQCRKQLRLIFQPVHDDGAGKLTTDDVTVHTFYEMDASDFRSMTLDILAARGAASLGDGAIDVHPVMKSQGPSGAFAKAINGIFTKYAGATNLVKITYLALRGGGVGWQMGGVDFVGTKGTDMTVPETTATREELTNPATAGDFLSTVDPPTKFSKGLGVFLRSDTARSASDDEITSAFKQALKIDNPETELHPGTVDCASCHLATPVRLWAERHRGLSTGPQNKVPTLTRRL
jgi:hypothetical protein